MLLLSLLLWLSRWFSCSGLSQIDSLVLDFVWLFAGSYQESFFHVPATLFKLVPSTQPHETSPVAGFLFLFQNLSPLDSRSMEFICFFASSRVDRSVMSFDPSLSYQMRKSSGWSHLMHWYSWPFLLLALLWFWYYLHDAFVFSLPFEWRRLDHLV